MPRIPLVTEATMTPEQRQVHDAMLNGPRPAQSGCPVRQRRPRRLAPVRGRLRIRTEPQALVAEVCAASACRLWAMAQRHWAAPQPALATVRALAAAATAPSPSLDPL